MTSHTFRPPPSGSDTRSSLLLGGVFAVVVFFAMAVTQLIGNVAPPKTEMVEEVTAYTPPEVEEIEEEEPPPPEEKEPPPELEREAPQLSLDQLDIALNPGTGGKLTGDFAMPTITASAQSLGTEDFVDFTDLDQIPRPMPGSRFKFPTRLRRKSVSGRIIVMLKLGEDGSVLDAEVESSDLPAFDDIVVSQIKSFRFTPPTQQGKPVKAQARLPIPIQIEK